MHDLAVYKVPEVFPKLSRTKTKTIINLMAGKADKVIAVSNSTKKDLTDILKVPEDKIRVICSGFDRRLFEESKVNREEVLKKYGIDAGDKYIMFLGTIEPVKNIARLFDAYRMFKESCRIGDGRCAHKLVLAGKNGWLASQYKQIAKDLGIEKDVIFTGYVAPEELVPLFKNADFFVMPSLYEGFGTTVLEAFATGTPAIVSGVSSIPEIAGDAAIFVNPHDTKEISDAMVKLSGDENLKKELREKGKKQLEKFDWEKTAKETLLVYESFL
jgi:glycosyltransferase involved in cell wall biosynthesis